MSGVKGRSGTNRNQDKPFSDAVRIACMETDAKGIRKLRRIAEGLIDQAMAGEGWAIQQVADRLEGKPAQDTTLNVNYRIADELSDDELAQRIAEFLRAGTSRTIDGSCEETQDSQEPDGVVPVLRIRAGETSSSSD